MYQQYPQQQQHQQQGYYGMIPQQQQQQQMWEQQMYQASNGYHQNPPLPGVGNTKGKKSGGKGKAGDASVEAAAGANNGLETAEIEPQSLVCTPCDKTFSVPLQYKNHMSSHKKCPLCDFSAMGKVLALHEVEEHGEVMSGDKPKKARVEEDPEDVARWIAERKKRYPTDENIQKKEEEAAEKKKLGVIDGPPSKNKRKRGPEGEEKERVVVCKYFMQRGKCNNGSRCRFKHVRKGEEGGDHAGNSGKASAEGAGKNSSAGDASKGGVSTRFGKRQNLRSMLLASEIRKENSILMQCIRHIFDSGQFDDILQAGGDA
ncbi:hypothetical protein HDV05_005067 [Chytridiales sp. JEL 0842]|nr:hypothetical protein HDV05_005067 [Chytridiales sp. JEL 0842]